MRYDHKLFNGVTRGLSQGGTGAVLSKICYIFQSILDAEKIDFHQKYVDADFPSNIFENLFPLKGLLFCRNLLHSGKGHFPERGPHLGEELG